MTDRAFEHGQATQDALLFGGEQFPAMIEHGAQAAVADGNIAHTGVQEIEVALDTLRNLSAGKITHPGRGQLDAQGNPMHLVTDAHDGRLDLIGQAESCANLSCPGYEQTHGVVI